MKVRKKRDREATRYLLLAITLATISLIAVYYVAVIRSPSINASARLKTSDNTVWLRGESGSATIAGWSFEYQKGGDNTWYSTSGDFGYTKEIKLDGLTGQISMGNNIVIKYDNSSNEYIVEQY